jgi:hypothetical protein
MKDKNKPLVEMSKTELRTTFDKLDMSIDFSLLEEARKGGSPCRVAVAILRSPNIDGEVVVLRDLEHGDNEGIRYIDDFIVRILRVGLLLPGETLTRKLFQVVEAEEVK